MILNAENYVLHNRMWKILYWLLGCSNVNVILQNLNPNVHIKIGVTISVMSSISYVNMLYTVSLITLITILNDCHF